MKLGIQTSNRTPIRLSNKLRLFLSVSFVFAIACQNSWGIVRVAFLKKKNESGQTLRLEPGGQGFYHVAIEVEGRGWLHAHPYGGVQISKDLAPFGTVEAILENPGLESLSPASASIYIDKPYDRYFSWASDDALYCSELIAKILHLKPQPMRFGLKFWKNYFARLNTPVPAGEPGMSPDGLYRVLQKQGFQKVDVPHISDCDPNS